MLSATAILPVLSILKWPATIAGAILVFGLSSEGTLSLVTRHASEIARPVKAQSGFNMPPVHQIAELTPVPVVPAKPVNDGGGSLLPAGWKSATNNVAASTAAVDVETASSLKAVAVDTLDSSGLTTTRPARIGSSAVNVRAAASKSSAKIGVLAAGTVIGVGQINGGWVHAFFEGGDGWVYSTYLAGDTATSRADVGVSDRPAPPPEPTRKLRGKLVQAESRIVVRDAPDSAASRLFRLEVGERVKIVKRSGEWAMIVTAAGDSGWIHLG
jgi:SH3-like domain-containing protein